MRDRREELANLVLMLCGLAAMLQASGFDCVAFDPFSFQQDCLAAPEVDVGWGAQDPLPPLSQRKGEGRISMPHITVVSFLPAIRQQPVSGGNGGTGPAGRASELAPSLFRSDSISPARSKAHPAPRPRRRRSSPTPRTPAGGRTHLPPRRSRRGGPTLPTPT